MKNGGLIQMTYWILFVFHLFPCIAMGERLGLLVGAGSLGGGHANPVSGQDPWEYKAFYLTKSQWEINVALSQLSLGKRATIADFFYVTLSGGILSDYNEYMAVGVISSFGLESPCVGVCLLAELSQSIGYRRVLIFPAYFRLGAAWKW